MMLAKWTRKVSVLLCCCVSAMGAYGQMISPTDSIVAKILDSDKLLPILLDSAVKNSGEVKRIDNSILLWKENVASNKKNIFSGVSLLSSYNYGTAGDLTLGKDNTSVNSLTTFRSTKGDRYNVGINVQIPLTYIIARKNLVRTSELQAKMSEGERDNAKTYVRNEVIRIYQELKLAQKLVILSGKNKQTAYVNYTLAEKSFVQGNGDLDLLSRLSDIYGKAGVEFESSINRFQTAYLQLQEYAGVKLSRLFYSVR